ncbi:MAG: PAS domain S-box protein [Thermodesulfobacteriota bacterium]
MKENDIAFSKTDNLETENPEIRPEGKSGAEDVGAKGHTHGRNVPGESHNILHDLQSDFFNILENTAEGIWILELNGDITFANTRMAEIVGIGKDELTGGGLWKLISNTDIEAFKVQLENVRKTGTGLQMDISYLSVDLLPVCCILHITPVFNKNKQVSGFFGKNSQITGSLKEVRENLEFYKKGEQIFRKLADADLLGVQVGDTEGNVTYVNDEMLRMIGHSREDYQNGRINWNECIAPEHRRNFHQWPVELLRQGELPASEKAFLRPDGTRSPFLGAAALVDPYSNFYVSFALDLSKIYEAEKSLTKNEERLEIAVSAMKLGVFEWEADKDTIRLENQRIYDILGRTPEQGRFSMEEFYTRIIAPEDLADFKSALEEAMHTDRLFHTLCRIHRQDDGEKRWVAFSGKFDTAEGDTQKRLVGVVADITKRKHLEEERERLNEDLEHQVEKKTAEIQRQSERLSALANKLSQSEQKERKRLAATLHDNIQPLIVSARMHLWEAKRQNDSRLQAGQIIDKVEYILEKALTSLRSVTMNLSPPILSSGGFSGALNWLAEKMAKEYGLNVNLYSEGSPEPASEEITGLVFDCIKELLFNVVKHSGANEADLSVSGKPGEKLKIVVFDRGNGFDKDVITTQSPEEMTFGLFSIQERLAYIGGEILVETSPGRGAKITLSVPAAEKVSQEDNGGGIDESPGKNNKNPLQITGKGHLIDVLIVDDHSVLRDGLKGMLQLEPDIRVIGEAVDGPGAVEQAKQLRPDVIIMDVNLGNEMDGVAATGRILAQMPQIKVIALSMYDHEGIAGAIRKAGASAYVCKSGSSDQLIKIIRDCF